MTTSRRRESAPGTAGGGKVDVATTLTVWHYDSAMGAAAGELRLRTLEERGALTVIDAITVVWMPHTPHPRVGRLHSRTGTGARRGAVLGAFAGALVLAPIAGAAAGAGAGALAGRLRHAGIDDAFLEEIKQRLTPGTSALLVLSENADLDAIRPFLERGRSRGDVTLMHAVLRDDAPDTLRELLDTMPSFDADPPTSDEPAAPPEAPSPRADRPRKETP